MRTLTTLAVTLACGLFVVPAASADTVGATAVQWGLGQVGTHEDGTSNCSTKIDRWARNMGLATPPCRPWCGAFVHEAFRQAGIDLSARLIDPAKSARDAVAGRRGLKAIAKGDVKPGDLLFFALHDGSAAASHIAIVTSKPSHGAVRTVEGNVSHAVRKKTRGLSYAVLAARVVR